ncbi:MAG: LytTR family DNA-binding domain-containing protein [Bacteroidales bacterium]|jgi:two-component system LytT family response regulator|nr:LytTR family DNA-binding domain-containing protein [Bacteroidales bacterium]
MGQDNKLRAVIIEDEPKDREVLNRILTDYYSDTVEVCGIADDIDEAVKLINRIKPDLVFLDIVLHGNRNGAFNILDRVHRSFQIIFITGQSCSDYYIKALRLNCIDYISKPTSIDDFKEPLDKAVDIKSRIDKESEMSEYIQRLELMIDILKNSSSNKHIALPVEYGQIIVTPSDIIQCKSSGNYTEFHFSNQPKRLINGNLKHYEELMADYGFVRVHKQVVINLKHITEYSRKEGGKLLLTDSSVVYIGESWKERFAKAYDNFICSMV